MNDVVPETGAGLVDRHHPSASGEPIPVLIQLLHSAVSGRLRFHVGGLKGSAALQHLLDCGLARVPGVSSVTASALTGNVLVHYDPAYSPDEIISYSARLLRGEIAPPEEEDAADAHPPWHRLESDRVAAELGTSAHSGLTDAARRDRLASHGPNLLPALPTRSGVSIFASQFEGLPVALLAGAATLSVVTGALFEAAAIMSVVLLNAVIGYQTESRAEQRIQSLGVPGARTARVLQDGAPTDVPTDALVPGDVLVLRRGAVVAADARIATARELTVSEAALTGESWPVSKSVDVLDQPNLPLAARTNMVYRGTIVTGGGGTGIVVGTGARTEVGRIQRLVGAVQAPETPMQRQLDGLGRQLAWLTLAAGGMILGIGWLRGFAFFQMLRAGLATAVAAVPEGLPMVATTTLALGVEKMRGHEVFVRRLDAIETLAAVRVVCFDKTGTLTFGRMSVDAVAVGERIYRRKGDALIDRGGAVAAPAADDRLRNLLSVGCLCSESELEEQEGRIVLNGSATENALVQLALDNGIDVQALRRAFDRVSLQQRTDSYRFMVSMHSARDGAFIAVKGAPMDVLARSRWEALPEGGRHELTPRRRNEIAELNSGFAEQALRVLGFAFRQLDAIPPHHVNGLAEELTWVGLAGMADPVRPDLTEVMYKLHRAGVRTVMLTGDQRETARAVAAQVGLQEAGPVMVVDAADIQTLSPGELIAAAREAHAFSRVSPAQKLQIVRALQEAGDVVAMVGDGINDSPALRASDVGVGMGRNGDAAAREVADVFLGKDDLRALLFAVEQGRTTNDNIRKTIRYLLSTNLSEVLLMLAGTAIGLGEALSPIQLLWINLISDVLPAISLALEAPALDTMTQPPKAANEAIVRTADFPELAGEAVLLSTGALAAGTYGALRHGFGSTQMRTLTFGSLVSAQLLHAVTCRSRHQSAFGSQRLPSNPTLSAVLAGSIGLQAAMLIVPPLRNLLGLAPIGLMDGLVIAGGGVAPFLVAETLKLKRTRSNAVSPLLEGSPSISEPDIRQPRERARGVEGPPNVWPKRVAAPAARGA
jgi:Ca2+-transporting ATPase